MDEAEVIVRQAPELSADNLVLGTHGATGISAFWSGSVAAKVGREILVPVLQVPV